MKDPCHGLDDKCSTNPMCYHKPYELKFTDTGGVVYNSEIYDKCKDGRVIYKFTRPSPQNDIYNIRKKNGNNFYVYRGSDPLDKEAFCSLDQDTSQSGISYFEDFMVSGPFEHDHMRSKYFRNTMSKFSFFNTISNNTNPMCYHKPNIFQLDIRNMCLSSEKIKSL